MINKVTLIGNTGADIQTTQTQSEIIKTDKNLQA